MSSEDTRVFRNFLSSELEQFQLCREKYLVLEATRDVIKTFVNDENDPNNLLPASSNSNDVKFKNCSNDLINEIFELQREMSKREVLLEKMDLLDEEKETVKKRIQTAIPNQKDLTLQAELEQAEILLQGFMEKSKDIDMQIAEIEKEKASAEEELRVVKENTSYKHSVDVTTRVKESAPVPNQLIDSKTQSETDINSELEDLQTSKSSLLALLNGLENIFQLELKSAEVTAENGLLISVVLGNKYAVGFELDNKKKLMDIQLCQSSSGSDIVIVDPLRLLCDCASLPPPHDLRHALVHIASSLHCNEAISRDIKGGIFDKRHPKSVHKFCLLRRDTGDFRKLDVTFRNGISATLKIHDCYPNVPNGVHILTLSSVGGWSESELRSARSQLNSCCIATIPVMITKILETFVEEE